MERSGQARILPEGLRSRAAKWAVRPKSPPVSGTQGNGYRGEVTLTSEERAGMCDSFEEFGPDAPTLCEGWTTRDLLAHLLVRERRPDAAAGIVVPYLRKHAADVTESIKAESWEDMIKQFRSGPPIWSVWAIPVLGDKVNLAEFFIHHEDIRRAQPEWAPETTTRLVTTRCGTCSR